MKTSECRCGIRQLIIPSSLILNIPIEKLIVEFITPITRCHIHHLWIALFGLTKFDFVIFDNVKLETDFKYGFYKSPFWCLLKIWPIFLFVKSRPFTGPPIAMVKGVAVASASSVIKLRCVGVGDFVSVMAYPKFTHDMFAQADVTSDVVNFAFFLNCTIVAVCCGFFGDVFIKLKRFWRPLVDLSPVRLRM